MSYQYAAAKVSKFAGPAAAAFLGISIWDNFENYKHPWARTAVDIAAFGLAAGIGVVAGIYLLPTFAVTAGVIGTGFLIGMGASFIKENHYGEFRKD